jgi:outer membrane receptor protein involved in Fe transport
VLLLSTALTLLSLGNTYGQSAPVYQFDIPAEKLGQALRDFSNASSQQIVFSDAVIGDRAAPALRGNYTRDQALAILLEGSGMSVDYSRSGVIMVRPKNAEAASNDGAASRAIDLETVVVTGSRIPDAQPASPVTIIDRTYIQNSGYSSTGDVIRSLPQNFSGGINPGVVSAPGDLNELNFTGASSVDLRGLGADSTLTLVDGHRLANDGAGVATDVSMIPITAIERIEIVTDGASALYGSDAVAGVANFILRKDFDGVETSARYGGATQGGDEDQTYDVTAGKNWGSGNAIVSYEYDRSNGLLASQRPYSAGAEAPFNLLPLQNRNSVFADVNQSITDNVSVYAEGLYTSRYYANMQTLYGTTYPDIQHVEQFGVSAGAQANLGGDWVANLDGTYSNDRALELPLSETFTYNNMLRSVEARATGTLFTLPTGTVKVAVGGGYRWESYSDDLDGHASRSVTYGFAEAVVPLVSPSDDRAWLERLSLDLAGRIENYSDFGVTANPRVGLTWQPASEVHLRGTWGTSFHAPSFVDEYGLTTLLVYPATFWGVTTPGAAVFDKSGANPGLQPEKSTAWTAGGDYEPTAVPGLKLTATYFGIIYKGRIASPLGSDLLQALSNPIYAPFVTPNPSAALQAQLIASAGYYRNALHHDYAPSDVIAVVDNTDQNVSRQDINGVDLDIAYGWQTDLGAFNLGASASWLKLEQMLLPTTPEETLSGTVFNPPNWKGRFNASWTKDNWVVSGALNYVDGEINNTVNYSNADGTIGAPESVASWTTVDVQVAYHTSADSGLLSGLRLALSVQNLFDADPPHIDPTSTIEQGFSFDSTNASPLGRYVSISLTKDW